MLATPVLGRVATWMARLPSPRLVGRFGLRQSAGAHAARQVSNDIVDLHLLSLRLPGQAASFRSLLQRLIRSIAGIWGSVGALVLANVVAAIPARQAALTRTAMLLRAE